MDTTKKNLMSDKINAAMVNGSIEDNDKILSHKMDSVELKSCTELSPDFEAESPTNITTENSANEAQVVSPVGDENSAPKEASPICETTSEELKVVLKQELETIFSQENFSKDKFLISQLDSDQYISLDIIMQLKPIECLTQNAGLILELLRELPNLQIDSSNTKVRLATPRSTIILREVPQMTPKEDIERLFEAPDCPPCARCEFAGNENWYVTFLTEDDAHRAYNHLRENVQSFLGKPIMARIKTSNTFISSSGKTAPSSGGRFHPSPLASEGLEVLPQHMHGFPAQAQPTILSNYYIPQAIPFYPELLPQPVWPQKFVESYNISMCQDLVYAQPFYGYSSQDGGATFENNSRQHKSSNSVHFRSGNHHYQHRSQADYGGGFFHRYGGSHNENRPPPRFLRQQMANMATAASEGLTVENHGFGVSSDDFSTLEKNSVDSRPAQSLLSVRHSFGSDRHVPNGFAKPTTSCKSSPDDKDRDSYSYSSRGKRFPERRGGFRGSRRSRNSDDGDKSLKSRQQENNLKSPKSKEIPTFLLESSSFPPLSSISNTSSTPTTTSCGTSYVQAVANSSLAHSYQSPQTNRLPLATTHGMNSSLAPPSYTSSEPLLHHSLNIADDLNGASDDRGSKMPSVKLSYAQIAQRTKLAHFKSQDNESIEALSGSTKTSGVPCSKYDRTNEKNSLLFQQQQQQTNNWNKKKHQMQNRKNEENFKVIKGASMEDDKYFKAAKKNEVENGRQSCEKRGKASLTLSQGSSFDEAREAEGRLVTEEV